MVRTEKEEIAHSLSYIREIHQIIAKTEKWRTIIKSLLFRHMRPRDSAKWGKNGYICRREKKEKSWQCCFGNKSCITLDS